MNTERLAVWMEGHWGEDGFLEALRRGVFDSARATEFLAGLGSKSIADDALVPRRLLSLVWYLPLYLSWQKERASWRFPLSMMRSTSGF